ncbi:MAG TPA: DinB family protein [Acidobacteriota bacterium]|nr:DinB family protein [Acidobacteriota bacterium]
MRRLDFIEYVKKEAKPIRYLISLVPEDKYDWSPSDNMMSLGKLVSHLARSQAIIWIQLEKVEKVPEEYLNWDPLPLSEALQVFDGELARAVEALSKVSDEDYLESRAKTFWGAEDKLCNLLMLLVDHGIHHKMQLFIYLKILGFQLGSEELYEGKS